MTSDGRPSLEEMRQAQEDFKREYKPLGKATIKYVMLLVHLLFGWKIGPKETSQYLREEVEQSDGERRRDGGEERNEGQ